MNRYSPFEDYLKWDRENVIHLEGTGRIINHPGGRALGVKDQKLIKNKIKSSHCSHCGALLILIELNANIVNAIMR